MRDIKQLIGNNSNEILETQSLIKEEKNKDKIGILLKKLEYLYETKNKLANINKELEKITNDEYNKDIKHNKELKQENIEPADKNNKN